MGVDGVEEGEGGGEPTLSEPPPPLWIRTLHISSTLFWAEYFIGPNS